MTDRCPSCGTSDFFNHEALCAYTPKTKPCAASIRPSEVFFLKEFLVEARAETGDTCLNTMIENLKELITIEDSMPGTFSATVMFNIRIAHSGLVVLAVAMEGPT